MSADCDRVLVLGGGVVGLSVANYLLASDYEVLLIDRQEPGAGVSYGNAGLIANFATLPAANRDALRSLPRQLLRNDSGISVRGAYWHRMLPFARRFLHSAQPNAYARNRKMLARVVERGCRELFHSADLLGSRDLIAESGVLLVYQGERAWAHFRHKELPQRRELGVISQVLDQGEIRELEPALQDFPMAGGVLYPEASHVLDPGALCYRLLDRFLARGGRFERAALHGIERADSRGIRVHSTAGTSYCADKAVVALGANVEDFLKRSQWRFPLVSERGYHIEMEHSGRAPTRPVGWADHQFFLTPMAKRLRAAGTTEFAHPEARADERRYHLLERWTEQLLGERVRVRSNWVGSRSTTPDGLPLIGVLPDCQDVVLATGHGHLGLTLSALTGQLVTDVLNGTEDQELVSALSPGRFSASPP